MSQNLVLDYAVLLMPCQEVFWEGALIRVQNTKPLSRSALNQLFKVTYQLKFSYSYVSHKRLLSLKYTAVENQCLIFLFSHIKEILKKDGKEGEAEFAQLGARFGAGIIK